MKGNSPPQSAVQSFLLATRFFATKSFVSITRLTTYGMIKTHWIPALMLTSCSLHMRTTATVMATLTGMLASSGYSTHLSFTLASIQDLRSHGGWISYGSDGLGETLEHHDIHTLLVGSPRDLNRSVSFQEIPLVPLVSWTCNKLSVVFTLSPHLLMVALKHFSPPQLPVLLAITMKTGIFIM